MGRREAAARAGISLRTLAMWVREGLVTPLAVPEGRGGFGPDEIARLRLVRTLRDELGVNLAGIAVALGLRERLAELEAQNRRLAAALAEATGAAAHSDRALVRVQRPSVVPARPRGAA